MNGRRCSNRKKSSSLCKMALVLEFFDQLTEFVDLLCQKIDDDRICVLSLNISRLKYLPDKQLTILESIKPHFMELSTKINERNVDGISDLFQNTPEIKEVSLDEFWQMFDAPLKAEIWSNVDELIGLLRLIYSE